MNPTQYVVGIVASSLTFGIVIEMLRRRKLRERHAFWWLLAGALALVASVFPAGLVWISEFLGFELPINLVFFFSTFILFLVVIQHSAELTKAEDHNRILAEEISMLAIRLDDLESTAQRERQ